MIVELQKELQQMTENPEYGLYAYLTYDDIRQLQNLEDPTG
jgi:hypothetical protein